MSGPAATAPLIASGLVEAIDAGGWLARLGALGGGGVASFCGHVRGDGGIVALELEHYPGMTEAALADIAAEAARRWPLVGIVVEHRVGRLPVGEAIVLVATASPHRAAALEACAYAIDRLKTDAPFWKREHFVDGQSAWVEAKAGDAAVRARWG